MKKILVLAVLAVSIMSCNNTETTATGSNAQNTDTQSSFKTAYIDTEKLMKEYQESIDFETKYEAMSKRMQNELEADMKKFQNDVVDLQRNAQSKGMEWAMARQKELEKREITLAEKQQNYMMKFQQEGSAERDSMVTKMKAFIKDYGQEKGFDYVFGTGDAATVLYAKDGYDITDDILKLMNEAYAKEKGVSPTEAKNDSIKK